MNTHWKDAMPIEQNPSPFTAGSQVTATVSGLNAGATYYFALKSEDEALLSSGLSNIATATTAVPSLAWSIQRVYWASWADYQNRQLSIDYRMSNAGTGIAIVGTVQASLCSPGSVTVSTSLPLTVGDLNPGIDLVRQYRTLC